MAWANRHRIFRLPRRADQQPGAERVSIPRPRSLASAVMSAQPKSTSAVAANDETGRRIPPPATSPATLAKCTLRRQTPEVGAECPNWARSDLCGGRSAMGVPTANRDYYDDHRVNDATYDRVVARFGDTGIVDLAGLIGYYSFVSVTLNVFEVPTPPGAKLLEK